MDKEEYVKMMILISKIESDITYVLFPIMSFIIIYLEVFTIKKLIPILKNLIKKLVKKIWIKLLILRTKSKY